MALVKTKNEVATIQLTPQRRAARETAAALETGSLANMFPIAILNHCGRHDLTMQGPIHDATLSVAAARQRPKKSQ